MRLSGALLPIALTIPSCSLVEHERVLIPEPLSISSLVGCYTTGESLIGLDSIPAELTLLQAPQDALQGWSPHHRQNAYWRILPGDTLEYVEGNSLYGWRFRGVRQPDALVGQIDGWTDVAGPPRRPHRLSVRRVNCPDGYPPTFPAQGKGA